MGDETFIHRRDPATLSRPWVGYSLVLIAATLLHALLAVSLPVSGDEAYLWDCARHPDWSYFDQPPLIIWGIALSRALLGDGPLAVRLPAILSSLLIGVFLLPLVRRLGGGQPEAATAYLLMHAMPVFYFGFFYASTDIAMAPWFLAAVWAAAVVADGDERGWWGFGSAVGVGFLGKFTAILAVGALAGVLVTRQGVQALRRPATWMAALLSVGITAPVWIWALRHHGDNLLFQLVKRHSFLGFRPAYLLEFLLANLVLATPPLLAALAAAWWIGWRRPEPVWRAVCAGAAAPLVVFGAVGLFERLGPHWAAPSLMTMAAPLAVVSFRRRRALLAWGTGIGILLNALILSMVVFPESWMRLAVAYPYSPEHISTANLSMLVGNRDIDAEVERRLRPGEIAASDSYSYVSLVAFLSEERVPAVLAHVGGGRHGLSALYWQRAADLRGRDVLFFTESTDEHTAPPHLVRVFAEVVKEEPFTVRSGGRVVRRIDFYRCRDLRYPEGVFTVAPQR